MMAQQAFIKNFSFNELLKMLREPNGLDRAYKFLMVTKLVKEMQRDFFPTQEEAQALNNNFGYIMEQVYLATQAVKTMTEPSSSEG